MKKIGKKILSFALCIAVVFCYMGIGSVAAADTKTISSDGSYEVTGSVPVAIADGVKATITLTDATIAAQGASAITLGENAVVTLVLKGTNTLKGDASSISAGIFVPQSAKLTIEGSGTLNVTGGKYGAGIGSDYQRVNGDIIINSGTINANGGDRGAGIGSGYHTSAGNITINGGVITAIGNGCGAGIGNGYGTSGGGEGKVGLYNGGNITITGGTVHAASFAMDFSKVDPYNPSCLTAYDTNTFAAGIGGGYGSSSGKISITGGDVIALGSCGGAGIGAGRGTSKAKNYDANAFFVDVNIAGNAKVVAMATDDVRNHQGGGAAIGSGRGCHTGGTINISGLADVTAIASPYASAIGSGSNVNPVNGKTPETDSITITDGVTLYAASDSNRYAIDTTCGAKTFATISGKVHQILFSQDVLNASGNTVFDLTIDGKTEKEVIVPSGMKSVAINASKNGTYYLKSGEYYGVQLSDSRDYDVNNTLSEETCVKLVKDEGPSVSDPTKLSNEFAYIYGKTNTILAPEDDVTRGEACAMLYRLLKQNDKLNGFSYQKDATPAFSDLGGRWDRSAVEYMTYIHVYATGADRIYPDDAISRKEAFKLFSLAMGYTTDSSLSYEQYANMLVSKGVVSGDQNGDLHLDDKLTRAEFCTVYNIITGRDQMTLVDASGTEVTAATYGFTDLRADAWYYDVMLKATSAYTNNYVDIEKRAIRNVLDDYE